MEIVRDIKKEEAVLEELKDAFTDRDGIHLTDLLTPRRTFWRKTRPKRITSEEAMYFLTGKGHEEIYKKIAGLESIQKQWEGIYYTIDFWYEYPVELKTRRWGLAKEESEESEYEHYLRQLRAYCAIEHSEMGYLLIWSLLDRRDSQQKPEFGLYKVEFTQEELEEERQRLLKMRDALVFALDFGDPSDLPLCPEWMCGKKKRVMIEKPYCHTCNREFQTDFGIEKHLNSQKGKGHKATLATYKEVYEPRCKWIEECRAVEITTAEAEAVAL